MDEPAEAEALLIEAGVVTCVGGQTCFALNDQSGAPVNVNGYALGVCQ